MTQYEYESIQRDISNHLERKKRERYYRCSQQYEDAVLACKSILSKYNPKRIWEMERQKELEKEELAKKNIFPTF